MMFSVLVSLIGLFTMFTMTVVLRVRKNIPSKRPVILGFTVGATLFVWSIGSMVNPDLPDALFGVPMMFFGIWMVADWALLLRLEDLIERGELRKANIYQKLFYKKYINAHLRPHHRK